MLVKFLNLGEFDINCFKIIKMSTYLPFSDFEGKKIENILSRIYSANNLSSSSSNYDHF